MGAEASKARWDTVAPQTGGARPSGMLRLAPGIQDLAALGLASLERALAADLPPRAERVATTATGDVWRLPLPGTPLRAGAGLCGVPRGAGTGWVRLERFLSVGARELVRTRFGAPRSESLAERRWNLICTLRAHGVGTPEPLCVARLSGGVFARRSLLVLRELEGTRPLGEVVGEERDAGRRAALCDALGSLLERLARSGVVLPRLAASDLFVGRARGACEAAPGGLAFDARPEVLVAPYAAALAGAHVARPSAAARRALCERVLAGLAAQLAPHERERIAQA